MNYPLHVSTPSEADLLCRLLASFSRVMVCTRLIASPPLGVVATNQTAKNIAAQECADLLVCLIFFQICPLF